ncbi:MAG: SAM-dependent methyltransferase [Flavobacteriaceae bacterium]|nr:SAM-dependent methyltransferase [Flavobacteriaceae bacterium]
MIFDKTFWDERYKDKNMGWDIGYVSTPLKTYFDQLTNKDLKILIPGGGNSYEAEYLHNLGFKNVYVVDISSIPLKGLQDRLPDFPPEHLIHSNFFDLDMTFDLIIEQTFFCALDKSYRPKYASHANHLLNSKGKIVGLLFDDPLYEDHPPFGGNKEEYISNFNSMFSIEIMASCYNSIEPRAGRELFIKMIKKNPQ